MTELGEDGPISPMQSATIKAAITAIAINAVTLIAVFTGKTFDIETIKTAIDYGVPMAVNALSMYYGWKAIKGRINATKVVVTGKESK